MRHSYERYILPDHILTMADYHKYVARIGHQEESPVEKMEIEHRMAKVAADKAAKGYIEHEYNSNEMRHSHAVNRCCGNGSHHRSSTIGRNY